MKIFRSVRDDFQARRNIEYYVTLFIASALAFLGLFGVVSTTLVSSATLAVLGLVTFGLLQNRQENESILKVISTTENLDANINEIVQHIGKKFDFIQIDGNYGLAKRTIRSLIEHATKEVLVLDYNPQQQVNNLLRSSPQDIMSDERRNYYDALLEKSTTNKPGQFRYRRILQIPDGFKVADILTGDTILKLHCHELVKISARSPEIASLKACPMLHEGAFILIDGRYLVVDLNILDPENHYYIGGGHFLFDDPTGEMIHTFRLFFDRAEAHATPVKINDLP